MIGGIISAVTGLVLGEFVEDEEKKKKIMAGVKTAMAGLDAATGNEAMAVAQMTSVALDVASSVADAGGQNELASVLDVGSRVAVLADGSAVEAGMVVGGAAVGGTAGAVLNDDPVAGLSYATMGAQMMSGSVTEIAGKTGAGVAGAAVGAAIGADKDSARFGAESAMSIGGSVAGGQYVAAAKSTATMGAAGAAVAAVDAEEDRQESRAARMRAFELAQSSIGSACSVAGGVEQGEVLGTLSSEAVRVAAKVRAYQKEEEAAELRRKGELTAGDQRRLAVLSSQASGWSPATSTELAIGELGDKIGQLLAARRT